LLPLSFLGYYNAAYSLAYGLASMQQFVNAAMLPALASDFGQGQQETLVAHFSKFTQILLYIVALPTFIFVFFGYDFLALWAGEATAQGASRALAFLAAGFLLNALASACYTLAIASGHTRVLVTTNLAALVGYIPAIYLLVVLKQLEGAALAWVVINLYYILSFLPYLGRRVLHVDVPAWSSRYVLPFMGLGLVFWLGYALVADQPATGFYRWLVCAICMAVYLAAGYFFLDPALRASTLHAVKRLLPKQGSGFTRTG
jgi:O-antigen/teichoic acid export membrane protein